MRIPVAFETAETGPDDAFLLETGQIPPAGAYAVQFTLPVKPGHAFGCACCLPRGPAASALGQMFRDRATGAAPLFQRLVVLASLSGTQSVREALANDVLAQARYRASDTVPIEPAAVES